LFKRARWVTIGAAVGFGGSMWARRKMRATMVRYLPDQVAGRAIGRARSVGVDLRAAFAEGQTAMRERERELRVELNAQRRRPEHAERPIEARYRHLRVVDAAGGSPQGRDGESPSAERPSRR
jgi:hypothetical protein